MKSTYRVLAYLISIEVVVQAAAIAFAMFGLSKWIEDGNTLDKAAMESDSTSFTGVVGFMIHGINGQVLIPLLAIVLLLVAFFAKVPGGVMWAGIVLALVVVQVLLGVFAEDMPGLGALHGINALILFAVSAAAGQRVRTGAAAGRGHRSEPPHRKAETEPV
ncbi:MAG: hypothetical protein ACRDO8_12120 [Nocardioidaceae bacterium]